MVQEVGESVEDAIVEHVSKVCEHTRWPPHPRVVEGDVRSIPIEIGDIRTQEIGADGVLAEQDDEQIEEDDGEDEFTDR